MIRLACVLLIAALGGWSQSTKPKRPVGAEGRGGTRVVEIERQEGLYRGDKQALSLTPMADGPRPTLPRAAVGPSPVFSTHFANPGLNSRLPAPLTSKNWAVEWAKPLDGHEAPLSILKSADRILVRFANSFQLFDLAGASHGRGPLSAGNVFLDALPGLFYVTTQADTLEGRRLENGAVAFQTSIASAPSLVYPLIARTGKRLIVVGTQIERFSHTPEPAIESTIQFKELGKALSVDSTGMLESVTRGATLRINSAKLFPAVSGDAIHFAVPGAVVSLSTDLEVRSACGGTFPTKLMSVDEAGNRYLLVEQNSRPALWAITADCHRFFNIALDPRYGSLVAPPIIGYDHRIFLVSKSFVLSISSEGRILWESAVPGSAAGAGVTMEDRLIVTTPSAILRFDSRGGHDVIAQLDGDASLVTYPVLTSDNRLLAASAHTLYCLRPAAQ